MKLNLLAGAICVSLIFSAPFAEAFTTTEIVQLAKPAVVLIEELNSQTGNEQSGTGFFVDPVTIVTNDHVMRGTYDKLAVHKLDGTHFTIDYVAFTSQQHDICVLRTKEKSSDWLNLSATLPLEGEPIVVIGNPKGLTGTISQGIVSALRENGVMQITAPVTQGSSGSPVLNMDGQVVAIVDSAANHDEANLGFSRDLRVLKPDVTISKNNRYGGAFSLAEQTATPPEPEPSAPDHQRPTPAPDYQRPTPAPEYQRPTPDPITTSRYEKAVRDAILSHWYYYVRERSDEITAGTVQIRFFVLPDGRVQDVSVVRNSSGEGLASVSLQSILDADIPPMPEELVPSLSKGRMKFVMSFTNH